MVIMSISFTFDIHLYLELFSFFLNYILFLLIYKFKNKYTIFNLNSETKIENTK